MDVNEKLAMLEKEVLEEMQQKKKNNIPEKFGIVLAGGGGKGAYQIGVLKALAERNLLDRVTSISGCSVGAINLLLYVLGDIELAETLWNDISYSKFLRLDYDKIDMKEGLFSRDELVELMEQYIDFSKISLCDKPLYVTVTEFLADGNKRPVYMPINKLTKEEIIDLILASSAMPIIYENIHLEGRRFKDGGITDNTPIKPLYDIGEKNILVIDLDEGATIDKSKYDGVSFIHIKPYKSIGGLIDGTLDFSRNGSKFRQEIGYLDAVRILDNASGEKVVFSETMNIMAENDYTRVVQKYSALSKVDTLNKDMDKINNMMSKYDKYFT